ncbi:MAG: TetR family transcriptional regulator [Gammaproteobacteria bacterium]|jgi:TetR/AcrR family acrAB operon transcriptional repressor|nr:TetR family transcriptional regulator [Gammaproteobacteria bacterium]MBU0787222.1 TetR family transcriptional regulator [Gammaproteobacteria bacterium]MBU0814229.1 TetR family transcriptional regulator [Gammaproteobacteria bacterium]MBU1786251.1 TetR family transcriptional regulator [Gammaproteobacteria bacterium]
MVRKTKEDAEQTYAMLLEAAEHVFFEKGVARTTLNDIATAAGVTRGAIYWHFKDKGALLRALFEQAMLPVEAMLVELVTCSEKDPLAALRYMCVHALTNLDQSPKQQRIFSIMFHKCENVGEVVTVLDDKLAQRDECLARVERILQKAVSMGQLPADTDVPLSHKVINNFMAGTMSEWLLAPQSYSLAKSAPAMVDMLIAGLRSNPPRLRSGA